MLEIDDGKSKEREPLFTKESRKMGEPMDFSREYQLSDALSARTQREGNEQAKRARERLEKRPRF